VLWIHGVAHSASYIDAEHQRVNHLSPRSACVLGQREKRRRYRACRVDDGFEVGVVKVKRVRRDAVDQRRAANVHLLCAAKDRGLRGGLQHIHCRQRSVARLMVRDTDGATQPVEEGSMAFMIDGGVPATRWVVRDIFGEDAGNGRGVVVGLDLGITCNRRSESKVQKMIGRTMKAWARLAPCDFSGLATDDGKKLRLYSRFS